MRERLFTIFKWIMYVLPSMEFLRLYIHSSENYLKFPAYTTGHERLPFQERILPVFVIRAMDATPWIARHFTREAGFFSADNAPYTVLSVLSLIALYFSLTRLYRLLSRDGQLEVCVYPMLLVTLLVTYTGHLEQFYRYPYDLPSLAFFSAGVYFVAARSYLPLVAVMLLGTLNRETTLFLIGLYLLDAMSVEREGVTGDSPIAERFTLRGVPWLRVALLVCIWAAIKGTLSHMYRFNDRSEDFLRIHYNLKLMSLRVIPAMLNLCGYLLPVAFFLRSRIRPVRFGNYVYIAPVWIALMFFAGVFTEVRIYGELCGFSVVAVLLILEETMRRESLRPGGAANHGPAIPDRIEAHAIR